MSIDQIHNLNETIGRLCLSGRVHVSPQSSHTVNHEPEKLGLVTKPPYHTTTHVKISSQAIPRRFKEHANP